MKPLSLLMLAFFASANAEAGPIGAWRTVVNNGDLVPKTTKNFNSYNQPSINDAGLVVFRARSQGGQGGQGPATGIFTRDMATAGNPIVPIAMRGDEVPPPNNTNPTGKFNEFPSFPRIDANSGTLAFRGQSTPSYLDAAGERSGTSGLYATPGGGSLVTGIRNVIPNELPQFLVPNQAVPTKFDQFPGAPSPDGNIVTFKGNWTDSNKDAQTGVYFRDMVANGGTSPVVKIAERGDAIPTKAVPGGGSAVFGSTSPPSAADSKMVFTGLDNEEAPTAGGIFMADLMSADPTDLTTVAGFQTKVPKNLTNTLSAFGEGLSFDGRYVGFWGGWGTETFARQVQCATDGNAIVRQACKDQDNSGVANDGIYTFDVLTNQGIFLADTQLNKLFLVAQTGSLYDDFLFWNFSGNAGQGGGDDSEDLEGARWRSSAFLAIDGNNVVFKAAQDYVNVGTELNPVLTGGTSGLFGALDVSDLLTDSDLFTIIKTGMDGGLLDPKAAGLPIVSLGIERDGFRNGRLAIAASMATAEAGWAGIYVTTVPEPGTWALLGLGVLAIPFTRRRCAVA
jgi:hypothetical protein